MSLFNDKLKEISLKEFLCLIIVLFVLQYLLSAWNIVYIDTAFIYIFIILYFIFKFRNELPAVKSDVLKLFDLNLFKTILFVVVLNIFFSYGMLYLADGILHVFPSVGLLANSFLATSLVATVIISPICEELIFRGVFLNKLKLIVPTLFAILISSLLFASLHTFGSIFSAFVFAVCLSILYLKTDNIFVPILAHFLNNLIAEILVILDSNEILFTNDLVVGLMSLLAIVSFILLSYSIIRQLKKLNNNDV